MEKRMLLVDDDPAVVASLRRVLRQQDFQLQTACCGSEALEMLTENPAQVVMSDFRMPHMNGIEFLTEVKQRWPDAARLMLSGQSDYDSTEEALAAGVVDYYLTKPWDNEELLAIIDKAFLGRGSTAEASTDTDEKPEQKVSRAAVIAVDAVGATEDNSPIPELPAVFSPDVLAKLGQDVGADTLPSLIDIFLKDATTRLQSLEVSAAADAGNVKHQLHTLGSSSALYGLMKVSALARRLEGLCDSDMEKVMANLPAFVKLSRGCLQQLEDYMAEAEPR
ncbi:response regulator [Aliamphritea spongicola]|uniref:response regulator n=1 Tax=Aliamphritea spongicola TaxID=707589 RepID=UPI00196A7347|nr:response regulator [Aliamphritea spongicola]MBN3560844.1 response regulator [Aliamphritea spongicola]